MQKIHSSSMTTVLTEDEKAGDLKKIVLGISIATIIVNMIVACFVLFI